MHSWRDDLEATPRDVQEDMDPHGEQFKLTDAMKWDRLTIRQWFNSMDEDNNGNISKQEWLRFLRQNPKFRAMLLNMDESVCPDRFSMRSSQSLQLEAKEMKMVMRLWKELDVDKNGTLDFDEFITLFERTGHYVQYRTGANPREQMASILSGTQANELSGGSGRALTHLAKRRISKERRWTMEFNLMQQIAAEPSTALHKGNQLPFDLTRPRPAELNRTADVVSNSRKSAPIVSSAR